MNLGEMVKYTIGNPAVSVAGMTKLMMRDETESDAGGKMP
jgi:hypothetical protein